MSLPNKVETDYVIYRGPDLQNEWAVVQDINTAIKAVEDYKAKYKGRFRIARRTKIITREFVHDTDLEQEKSAG